MSALRRIRDDLAHEWAPTLRLAVPVALGQVGLMLMGIVDTLFVGPLGGVALGSIGVAVAVYTLALLVGMGTLLGLDRVAAVAHGAGRREEIDIAYNQGLLLAFTVSVPLIALLHLAAGHLARAGIDPSLVPGASAALRVLSWSILPTLVFQAARQTLQALHDTRAAALITIAANVVNAVANYAFVYGHLGAPRMGLVGSAWATNLARLFMAVFVLAWSARQGLRFVPAPHPATLRELLRLGIPASVQLFFEGGVFSLSTVLMARFGASAAAAHQVVMQIASFTFMVPLGVSIAGAVRVGNALGRDDPEAARRAGWSAVTLAAAFMVCSGVALLFGATAISQGFHLDPEAAGLARKFLVCAAFFQLFDGMQISLSGALRGTGDTVASMVANLVGHWGVGLPVGCLLAFSLGLRGVGLWLGLAAGLFTVAVSLLVVWRRRIRGLAEREAEG